MRTTRVSFSLTDSEPPSLKARFESIEFVENALFGISVFCLAAAFSTNLNEHFALPKLVVFRSGSLVFNALLLLRLGLGHVPAKISRWTLFSGAALALWWLSSTLFAVHFPTALHGAHGRYNGLLNNLICLLLFYSFAQSGLTLKRIELLVKLFVLALIPVALYALVQSFNLDPYHWPAERPASTMGHPVLLAALLGLAVPFLTYLAITIRLRSHRILFWICLIVCVVTALITLSRGPIIGMAFSLILMVTVAIRQGMLDWKKVGMGVGVALIACLTFYGVNRGARKGIDDRFISLAAPAKDTSIIMRFVYYDAAKRMIQDRPIMGSGFENFRVLYPQYRSAKDRFPDVIPTMVHNMYIERAVSGGIPGVFLYMCFIASILFALIKAAERVKSDKKARLFIYSFLAALSGYLIQELSGWQDVTLAAFFWIIAGLSTSASSQTKAAAKNAEENARTSGDRRWARRKGRHLAGGLAVSLGCIGLLVIDAVRKMRADEIFWQAERKEPTYGWSDLEALTRKGVELSGRDYYYEDKGGIICAKRFAVSGTTEAYAKALGLFEQAFAHNPFDSYIVLHAIELDSIALSLGIIKHPSHLVEQNIRSIQEMDRNNPRALERIAILLVQVKRFPEASKWVRNLRQLDRTGISSDLLEGEIARGMGDTSRALKLWRPVIVKMEQDNSFNQQWINTKLAVAAIEIDRRLTVSALRGGLEVVRRFPREVRAYILLGDVYSTEGNFESARDSYKVALGLEPSNQVANRRIFMMEGILQRSR